MSWGGTVYVHLPDGDAPVVAGTMLLTEVGANTVDSRFAYDPAYLRCERAIPIDPCGLPIGDAAAGREYSPPAGLPLFGAVRDAAPDAWGRRVIEARLGTDRLPESTYLRHAGAHRFGALAFDRDEPAWLPSSADLPALVDAADDIEAGAAAPYDWASGLDRVVGLGGARPKVAVLHRGVACIAKLPSGSDRFDVPAIEFATLAMARRCGMRVPGTDLVTLPDGRHVLISERFDRRRRDDGRTARIHAVSALTMLGIDEMDSPHSSYAQIAHAIAHHGARETLHEDLLELVRRIALNIVISNGDDHLRNSAFIWDAPMHAWRLSPAYDLVPHPQVAEDRRLHLAIGPRGRAADIENLLAGHGALGLDRTEVAQVIERVVDVVRDWRAHFTDAGVDADQCHRVQSAIRFPGIDRYGRIA